MKYGQIWMKKYAERSEAKKKTIKIKRGPKKLNFGASKPGVRGGPGPLGPPPGSASAYVACLAVNGLEWQRIGTPVIPYPVHTFT